MARPTRKDQIPNLPEAIKETAWAQIAENGAPALSLRAVARELGITAPAIYNYFPRRDDLVTALIVDAFTSLGDSQRAAVGNAPVDDPAGRLFALGNAYREWALAYPQRYQLIFGTPLPNYEAPAEVTLPAAAGSLAPLVETLQLCRESGMLRTAHLPPLTPELKSMLDDWSQAVGGVDREALYKALVFWSRVHGLVSLEIGHQLPSFFMDPGEIFSREIAAMVA